MTTNELKCPVCGEGMEKEFYAPWLNYRCKNIKCPIDEAHIQSLEYGNKLIQSRIDKEKAAAVQVAVQQERERGNCKTCSHERGCSSQVSVMTVAGRIPVDISGCSAHELKFALKKKLYQEKKALNIT